MSGLRRRQATLPYGGPGSHRARCADGAWSPGAGSVIAALVGTALLVMPLPGCPGAVAVWASSPAPRPAPQPPALDDSLVAADQASVATAQRELSAHDRAVAAARTALRVTPGTTTRTVSGADSALSAAVERDQQDVAQAQAALNEVVEQQQASEDPGSFDDEVASAQEDLDLAEASLAGDQQALAESRKVVVATSSPAPVSASARTTVQQAPAVNASLVRALQQTRHTQAQHLADRKQKLADWAGSRASRTAAVDASNARLSACEGTTRPFGAVSLALLVTAGGLLLLRRRQASAASSA